MSYESSFVETFKENPTFFLLALLLGGVGFALVLVAAIVLGKRPRVTMGLGAAAAVAAVLAMGVGFGGAAIGRTRMAAVASAPGLTAKDRVRLTLAAAAEGRHVRNFGLAVGFVPLIAGIALFAAGLSRSQKRASP
jgi:hypothetical protein